MNCTVRHGRQYEPREGVGVGVRGGRAGTFIQEATNDSFCALTYASASQ